MELDGLNTLETLPFLLKLKILSYFPRNEYKRFRLISTTWLQSINWIVKKPSGTLRDSTLRLFNNFSYPTIGQLSVQNLTQQLKLYSSTRCEIPFCEKLVLRGGISGENVVKLMKFYCKNVRSLSLVGFCLADVNRSQIKDYFSFDSLQELTFKVYPLVVNRADDADNDLALSRFLETKFKFPNLAKLTVDTKFSGGGTVTKPTHTSWYPSMSSFLSTQNQLSCLTLRVDKFNFNEVVQLFDGMRNLVNVECLDLSFDLGPCVVSQLKIGAAFNYLRRAFTNYGKLQHFKISCNTSRYREPSVEPYLELLYHDLMKNCGKSLKSMHFSRTPLRRPRWLFKYPALNLTTLELVLTNKSIISWPRNGRNPIPKLLPSVVKVKVLLPTHEFPETYSYKSYTDNPCYRAISWVIRIAPNLQILHVTCGSNPNKPIYPRFRKLEATVKEVLRTLNASLVQFILTVHNSEGGLKTFKSIKQAIQNYCATLPPPGRFKCADGLDGQSTYFMDHLFTNFRRANPALCSTLKIDRVNNHGVH